MLYMAHTQVEVEISDIEKGKFKKMKVLVDTGASLSVLPKRIAKELGIEAESVDEVATGAGIIKVKRGTAWIKLRGKGGCSMSGFQT